MIQLLISFLVKGSLVLASTAVLAALSRTSSATVRHLIWTAGVNAALLMLPIALAVPNFHLNLIATGHAGAAANTVMLVWLTVTVLLLFRIFLDRVSLRRLAVKAEQVTCEESLGAVKAAATIAGVGRHVTLRQWKGSVPATFGTGSPTIFLPPDYANWGAKRLSLVLLHEMAHVARLDDFSLILSRISCAVFWFNPISWWGLRQIGAASEEACDDIVLGAGIEPLDYAAALLDTTSDSARGSTPGRALAMAPVESLERRLRIILSGPRPYPPHRRNVVAIVALVYCGALILAPLRLEAKLLSDYDRNSRELQEH